MIFSKQYNFLYLKNRKVGGSSTEIALSQIMPFDAIVTPIFPIDIRHETRNNNGFYNHMTYKEVASKLDLTDIDSCVVVRNPYDSVLSDFFLQLEYSEMKDLFIESLRLGEHSKYVDEYFNDKIRKPWLKSSKNIYTINEEICVKHIIKYEHGIEKGLNKILYSKGLSLGIDVRQKSYRPKNIKYQHVFSKKYLDIIKDEWHWEFKNLGYDD